MMLTTVQLELVVCCAVCVMLEFLCIFSCFVFASIPHFLCCHQDSIITTTFKTANIRQEVHTLAAFDAMIKTTMKMCLFLSFKITVVQALIPVEHHAWPS